MKWKWLAPGAALALTPFILATLAPGSLPWTQHQTPRSLSGGPGVAGQATNEHGQPGIDWLVDADLTAGDDDAFASADGEREAAAGPQPPEEDGPPAPAPAPTSAPDLELPSAVRRVGIQAGHWNSADLPDELARLRTSTGTSGGGKAEWELNLDIARRVADLLEAEGIVVDVIPATVPPGYKADVFVALHADGDASGRLSGFKLARARWSAIPEIDDALLAAIVEEYQAATELPEDTHISRNMTGYYAFNYRRFTHAIAPTTPAVIVEMGFMTNAADRRVLLGAPDTVAEGIARGIRRFLDSAGQ